MRPILAENGGWSIFNYTPRGKNHGYSLYNYAKEAPQWFTQVLTVDDTGAIPPDVLENERKEIVAKYGDDALFKQEYYCSFQAPLQGSFYGHLIEQAEKEGRVTLLPIENTPIDTYWDLGVSDATAIWFVQNWGKWIHVIDYYEASGVGLKHYLQKLQEYARDKGYIYRDHWAPHDIKKREWTSGKSMKLTAQEFGIYFREVPDMSILDGIDAARNIIPKCYFHIDNCDRGLNALRSYRKEWDENRQEFKASPYHDWASHGADAFRYFAVAHRPEPEHNYEMTEEDRLFDKYGIF